MSLSSPLIADHGAGFDPSAMLGTGPEGKHSQATKLGLTSLRERTEMVGASFAVELQPGSGTRIRMEK
jgi:signal transduction histidine kinase